MSEQIIKSLRQRRIGLFSVLLIDSFWPFFAYHLELGRTYAQVFSIERWLFSGYEMAIRLNGRTHLALQALRHLALKA
jgi:hypothetical protein